MSKHWNQSKEPLKHFCLNSINPTMSLADPPVLEITRKMQAELVDALDDVILYTIFQGAKEAGITDLYLIDKEFIISAIQHEKERRGLC